MGSFFTSTISCYCAWTCKSRSSGRDAACGGSFAGGGSIPLETLRIGCDAYASDLNPVACFINKILLEDIPRKGKILSVELKRAANQIKEELITELAYLYPVNANQAKPIAFLWARTVRCGESPSCGAEIPLLKSFWLSYKERRKIALRIKVIKEKNGIPHLAFEVFEPKLDSDVPNPTINRANATCPCCRSVLMSKRVRAQISAQMGCTASY